MNSLKKIIGMLPCIFKGHAPVRITTFMDGVDAMQFFDEGDREILVVRLCRRCGVLYWESGRDVPCKTAECIEEFEVSAAVQVARLHGMGGKRNGEVQ